MTDVKLVDALIAEVRDAKAFVEAGCPTPEAGIRERIIHAGMTHDETEEYGWLAAARAALTLAKETIRLDGHRPRREQKSAERLAFLNGIGFAMYLIDQQLAQLSDGNQGANAVSAAAMGAQRDQSDLQTAQLAPPEDAPLIDQDATSDRSNAQVQDKKADARCVEPQLRTSTADLRDDEGGHS